MGSKWVIGNGKRVHIWNDRWILVADMYKVISPKVQIGGAVEMVSRLMDDEGRGWNADLIRTSFLPHEAEVILGILISPIALEDSQVWTKTPNGTFTVNNAYKVAYKLLKEAKSRISALNALTTPKCKPYGKPYGIYSAKVKSSILCGEPVGIFYPLSTI